MTSATWLRRWKFNKKNSIVRYTLVVGVNEFKMFHLWFIFSVSLSYVSGQSLIGAGVHSKEKDFDALTVLITKMRTIELKMVKFQELELKVESIPELERKVGQMEGMENRIKTLENEISVLKQNMTTTSRMYTYRIWNQFYFHTMRNENSFEFLLITWSNINLAEDFIRITFSAKRKMTPWPDYAAVTLRFHCFAFSF